MSIKYASGATFAVFGRFVTGRTITCAVYNGETGASIALTSNACAEIGTTGIYRFNNSNFTTPITTRTILVWQMTDTSTGFTDEGFVVAGDETSGQTFEIWQDLGLDVSQPKTITEITEGQDYDEDVDSIHKDVVKVGAVTTITRT